MPAYTETAFEAAIEEGLVVADGYQKRQPADYDEALALFPDDVIGFIRDSQPKRWEQLETLLADKTRATLLDCLAKELATKGSLHVLRHGFKCYGKSLRPLRLPATTVASRTKTFRSRPHFAVRKPRRFGRLRRKTAGFCQTSTYRVNAAKPA